MRTALATCTGTGFLVCFLAAGSIPSIPCALLAGFLLYVTGQIAPR